MKEEKQKEIKNKENRKKEKENRKIRTGIMGNKRKGKEKETKI